MLINQWFINGLPLYSTIDYYRFLCSVHNTMVAQLKTERLLKASILKKNKTLGSNLHCEY